MATKKAEEATLEVGSPEWRKAKREARAALDERLGTARVVKKRAEKFETI